MSDKSLLSRQEEKVLLSLAEGNLYKEIAIELEISINTVKKHLKNIYRKLEVSSRKMAVGTLLKNINKDNVQQGKPQNSIVELDTNVIER